MNNIFDNIIAANLPPSIDKEKLRQTAEKLFETQLELQLAELRLAIRLGDPQQVIMAIPMLLALTICPAMLGTQEAIRSSQSKTRREEHRARRCNLITSCVKPSIRSRDINGKQIVLRDGKLYISNEILTEDGEGSGLAVNGHPFAGYFLPYPDSNYEGLVSTIYEDPPILNWIYVDRDTYEVKYGLRVEAQPHITGPFDCTRQDRRMTLQTWEGFVAVEEYPGVWALYFDKDDDGLGSKVPLGTRVLEIELTRREKKEAKPKAEEQPHTLDEMMKQHKEQTVREEKEKEDFCAMDAQQYAQQKAEQESQAQNDGDPAIHTEEVQAPSPSNGTKHEVVATDTNSPIVEGAMIALPPSPSTETEVMSTMWSNADGVQDEDALTVASSRVEGRQLGDAYKKPYVEDDVQ